MFRNLTVSGVKASLKWGYAPVAELADWTVTKAADNTWTVTATVVTVDTFKASQRPLVFAAPHAKGVWRWPVEELQIADRKLSARLGPKEK